MLIAFVVITSASSIAIRPVGRQHGCTIPGLRLRRPQYCRSHQHGDRICDLVRRGDGVSCPRPRSPGTVSAASSGPVRLVVMPGARGAALRPRVLPHGFSSPSATTTARRYDRPVEGVTRPRHHRLLPGWTSPQLTALVPAFSVLSQGVISLNEGIVLGLGWFWSTPSGRMWSVALTDLFQSAVIIVGLTAIAFLVGDHGGAEP